MVRPRTVAAVVEHRRTCRRRNLTGLLVGQLAGRIVGRDIGEAQALHESAGRDANDVGRRQALATTPCDDIDDAEMRLHALQSFAVEESTCLNGLVQRREHDVCLSQQAIDQIPCAG